MSSDDIIKEIYNDSIKRKVLLKTLNVHDKDYKKKIIQKIIEPKFNYKIKKNLYPLIDRLRKKKTPSFLSKKNIFFEVPLLFEEKLEKYYDAVIFIKANQNIRLKRCLEKKMTREYFKIMNDRQAADGPKEYQSQIIINNNGSVMNLYQNLCKMRWFI